MRSGFSDHESGFAKGHVRFAPKHMCSAQAPSALGQERTSASLFDQPTSNKILQGASPDDLPVEQPVTFELSLNLKATKARTFIVAPLKLPGIS